MEGSREVPKEGATFEELVEGCSKGQKEYLYYIASGFGLIEAERLIEKRGSALVRVWRESNGFGEIERYVEEHRGRLKKEALLWLIESWGAVAHRAFSRLLEMGLEWDKIKKQDQPYVMKAIMFILSRGEASKAKEGYKDFLKRIKEGE